MLTSKRHYERSEEFYSCEKYRILDSESDYMDKSTLVIDDCIRHSQVLVLSVTRPLWSGAGIAT